MKTRSTKKALLASLLSLVVCVSMLVGSTFAWFTDSVASAQNVIQSGNLDVELYYADKVTADDNGNDTTVWKPVTSSTDIYEYNLWEPGYTKVAYFKVVNEGSLALKYTLSADVYNETAGVNQAGESFLLSDYLKTSLVNVGVTRDDVLALEGVALKDSFAMSGEEHLTAGASKVVGMAIWMPTTVGNVANHNGTDVPAIEFGINLFATQDTVEADSFDKFYDKDAYLPVVYNIDEFKAALADGKSVRLGADITVTDADVANGNAVYYTGDEDITIDLGGKTLIGDTSNAVIRLQKAAGEENTVTIKNGKVVAGDNAWSAISIGSSAGTTTYVNLENLEISSSKANDLAVRARTGAEFTMTDCKVTATNGAGGIVAGGGNVTLNNVIVEQYGYYNWNSVALGVSGSGTMTVNSGTYTSDPEGNAAGTWVAYIMSSGGTLEINGGTFTGTTGTSVNASSACGIICADRAAVVKINGGTFNSTGAILDMRNNVGTQPNPTATIRGGTFSADPRVSGLYSSNLIKIADGHKVVENSNGTWSVFAPANVSDAQALKTAIANGQDVVLTADVQLDGSLTVPAGVKIDGNGNTLSYSGEYAFHNFNLSNGSEIKNVNLKNYKVNSPATANSTFTLENVVVEMPGEKTGLNFAVSGGTGTAMLKNVTCKNITNAAHLDPATTVQADYHPYGDVLLGGGWNLDATDCTFGSLHGWNARTADSYVKLTNATATVFRMHYIPNRKLFVDGVETAWSASDAIPVAHDVGGCWSVQPAFR